METILSRYTNLVNAFSEEQSAFAIRPTKAASARLRKLSQQISNLGADLRKELVAHDKNL